MTISVRRISGSSTTRRRSFMAQPFKSPTGIYQLRRKVPPELRSALGHEYKRSLQTRNPVEAKARFAEEWARSEETFLLARAQAEGVSKLGIRDMQQLASRWFRAELEKLESTGDFTPWLVEDGAWSIEQGDHHEEHVPLISVRQALEEDDGPDFTTEINAIVTKALREAGGRPERVHGARIDRGDVEAMLASKR